MSDVGIIRNIVENNKEKEIAWEIADFFDVAENKKEIQSPQFLFAGVSWYLRIFTKSFEKIGFMNLVLVKVGGRLNCSVEYSFELKTLDNGVEQLRKAIFEKLVREGYERSKSCFLKLSEIKERKSKLSDVFTILCKLKHEAPHLEILKLSKLDALSENFRSLLLDKDSCDTTLLVMDKQYKAHKTVLMARSTVFAAMFLHETSEKQTGVVTIQDCDSDSFGKFLEFMYTGKMEQLSPQDALHLYVTSDKYDVRDLKTFCAECLIHDLTIKHFWDVVVIAEKYDDSKLSSSAQDFFNANVKEIVKTSEWDSLVRNNYRLSKKLLEEMLNARVV